MVLWTDLDALVTKSHVALNICNSGCEGMTVVSLCVVVTLCRTGVWAWFPAAPAGTGAGPCGPVWSDCAPESIPLRHARRCAAESPNRTRPHTGQPPAETKEVLYGWLAQRVGRKGKTIQQCHIYFSKCFKMFSLLFWHAWQHSASKITQLGATRFICCCESWYLVIVYVQELIDDRPGLPLYVLLRESRSVRGLDHRLRFHCQCKNSSGKVSVVQFPKATTCSQSHHIIS